MDNDTEAPKDPGVKDNQRYTEQDYEGGCEKHNNLFDSIIDIDFHFLTSGHRAHTVFVGVHLPNSRRHSHRRHKHHHKDGERLSEYDRPREYNFINTFNELSRNALRIEHIQISLEKRYTPSSRVAVLFV